MDEDLTKSTLSPEFSEEYFFKHKFTLKLTKLEFLDDGTQLNC